MSAWWYAAAGEKIGPLTQAEIAQRIAAGEIGAQTLLWQAGMDAWQSLADIAELRDLPSEEPSVVPPTATPVVDVPASRTRRWLARSFDLLWEVVLVSAISGAVLGYYSADFLAWLYTPAALLLFGFVNVALALLLDAVLYRVAANTPGKALLGVRVSLADGSRLHFNQYLGRNLRLLTLLGLAMVSGTRLMHEAERAQQLTDYVWTNPVTGRSAKIDAYWKIAIKKNSQGQAVYIFSERAANLAGGVLAVSHEPGWTLNKYVQVFRGTVVTMRLDNAARYLVWAGRPAWEANGTIVDHPDRRSTVRVVQVGDDFWSLATVQAQPYVYSDAQMAPLQTALWRTVVPEAADTPPEAAPPPASGAAPKTSGKASELRL